jgi:hypothetical protein
VISLQINPAAVMHRAGEENKKKAIGSYKNFVY